MVLGFSLAAWRFGRRRFAQEIRQALWTMRTKPLAWFLGGLAASLFALILTIPPTNWDSMVYNLARVLLMHQENTLGLTNYNSFRQLAFSPGFDLLHFFFLRYRLDQGIAVFSLMAYLIILLAGYSLAKEKGGRDFALRVAVVIGSLKLLVLQASSTKNDIGAAAMAVACILSSQALFARKKTGESLFFLTCLAFGLSIKTYFLLFAAPFLLSLMIINRADILGMARTAWSKRPGWVTLGLAFFLLLALMGSSSQLICLWRFGNPYGPQQYVTLHENVDGLAGMLANLSRYAMQVLDLPGRWWNETSGAVHHWLFGAGKGPGAAMQFQERYSPAAQWFEDEAWFGLTGGLLILPSLLAGLAAPGRITRSASWGLCGYVLLVSATIAWMNYNCRFFTLFFSASALSLIASRPVWHDRIWIRRAVLAVSMATALTAMLLNQDKPLLDYETLPGDKTDMAQSVLNREPGRRAIYDAHFNGSLLLEYLSRGTFPNQRILLVAGGDSWVYPLLFYTGHSWLVTGEDNPIVSLNNESYDIRDCGQLSRLAAGFDLVVVMEYKTALECRPPWKQMMRTWSNWGDIVVYDPNLP